ncbi:MAG: hypothetical protein GX325_01965 [Peptococcaceae bacterium]|nr:hypothetical protein [Peptococcaceae bacterium]
MKKVPVVIAWIVNAFENSSQHSEYYVDLKTGDVKFFSPLDFPEHIEIMEKLDRQTNRYIRLPKIEKAFSLQVKKDYIATIKDEDLRRRLENEFETDTKYRKILMGYEDERHEWYKFQNEKYADFLKKWFMARGIEILDK